MTEKFLLLIAAMRDARTPWYAKAMVIFTLAYIISPIDIIPDFIPVLGLLDEAILVPIALTVIFKLIPETVKQENLEGLDENTKKKLQFIGAFSVLVIWILTILIMYKLYQAF